jgi:hypothetical protein
MNQLRDAIQSALESEGPIPRQQVRQWIQSADSVEAEALLYQLTRDAWNRIEPRLESDETSALIQRYLLRCIRDDPEAGVVLSRYEAASELERWFDYLAEREDAHDIVQGLVIAVTDLFLGSDDNVRRAIETGFLEHVLEQRKLRHWFSHWAVDERLHEAWRLALAWGDAHPNFVKGLRAHLQAVQSDAE